MASLRVLYRAIVMVGTLSVAGLALVAYGPELQKFQPLVDRLKTAATEMLESESSRLPHALDAEDSLASFSSESAELQAMPVGSPRFDNQVEPANWEVAEASVSQIVRQLEQMGVEKVSLTPWGTEGNFYRFECSATWGTGGAFARQFEAIASDPATAARQVLSQVESVGRSIERRTP